MRKKIEGSFPLREINRLAMSERTKKGHPGNIHLWWNRSPVESSEKLLKAMLEDDLPEADHNGSAASATVVDPFCGSGCLTLAATRCGLPVMAGDINSVAVLISKAVAEIPYRFLDCKPVSPDAEIRMYHGLSGLSEDVRSYGKWIKDQLSSRLASYYPEAINPDENGKLVYAWIWMRTALCPNPACNCTMPLSSSYVISRQKGRECYARPIVSGNKISFEVVSGAPESVLNGNKIGKHGAQFQCPICGTITSDEYIKNMGQSGRLGLQLMAVSYETREGRINATPKENQMNAIDAVNSSDPIIGDIPDNTRWFSPPLFGLKTYADLYTPRQLLLMNTLFDLIGEAQKRCRKDAISAGWSNNKVSLDAGGKGALAYSQAIALYLSLAVSKMANYQSEICTWDNRTGNIRAAFTRQAIPMTWTFGEGNPFSSVTGNLKVMLEDVVSTIEKLDAYLSAKILNADAMDFPFPQNSILFTELPYYDNVGYSDLSDYFYVWLRRGLKGIFPKLFKQVVSSKDELTSIPEHFGGNTLRALEFYDKGVQHFCESLRGAASQEYPSALFFEFGKQDEAMMSAACNNSESPSHWENLVDALVQAGFRITATLPIRSEMPNDNYDTFRIAVIFRIRECNAPETIRRSFVAELKRVLPNILKERFKSDVEDHDRPYVGMGCGLELFGKYSRVINADGSYMNIRDALRLIWTEVSEYLANDTMSENDKEESNHG